jgi:uncharacterized membrane protein (GlpM family)
MQPVEMLLIQPLHVESMTENGLFPLLPHLALIGLYLYLDAQKIHQYRN